MAQRSFEVLLVPAKLVLTFVDREAAIVAKDVGVAPGAVLSVHYNVALYFVTSNCVDSHRVEGTGRLGDVNGGGLNLGCGSVANCEAAVVVRHVLVAVVAALSESLLVGAAFVHKDWFEMA